AMYVVVYVSTLPCPPCIYSLSLHDALPIWALLMKIPSVPQQVLVFHGDRRWVRCVLILPSLMQRKVSTRKKISGSASARVSKPRSEEHTSELQSRQNLVCRLLLEKKTETSS